ncbi:prepronociceptin b isoform X1 [Electrophorus electricus]|uniref:Prepronociceptin b n=1 Tax=Electrophorus electricus TaxID=8005 RepID=A0AAY5F1Q7_ELEEL|nr:prepronociceptin b isoform X1 [Electrophorus electricus]
MKAPLWSVLFLSLCASSRSDCQADCLTCSLLLSQHQAFSTLVCLLECQAQPLQSLTWDLCFRAVGLNPPTEGALQKRSAEEGIEEPAHDDGGVDDSEVLERFRHAAQALAGQQTSDEAPGSERLGLRYGLELDSGMEEEDEEEEEQGGAYPDAGAELGTDSALDLSKRFGGFVKGRHGFRKLVSSGRHLQKRYGGFIGIRKSARKWNNQKRVSQLLRQYLSLTSRSGRYNKPGPAALRQKN